MHDGLVTMNEADLDRVTAAVVALNPQPRARRWVSLTFCVLDAVWSIGANYDTTVVPVVKRVAADCDIEEASVVNSTPAFDDPLPLSQFVNRYDVESLTDRTNRQRTSTSGGVLKAYASLQYADKLLGHGVDTIDDARTALTNPDLLAAVEKSLRGIPGDGSHGIRRSYFWMLVGDDSRVKPDRMVLRWFTSQGLVLDPKQAMEAIDEIVVRINAETHRTAVTAWEVDHALWNAGRDLPA